MKYLIKDEKRYQRYVRNGHFVLKAEDLINDKPIPCVCGGLGIAVINIRRFGWFFCSSDYRTEERPEGEEHYAEED